MVAGCGQPGGRQSVLPVGKPERADNDGEWFADGWQHSLRHPVHTGRRHVDVERLHLLCVQCDRQLGGNHLADRSDAERKCRNIYLERGSERYSLWLDIGSTPGANDVYQSGNLGNVTSTNVSSLPANGNTIYTTLYSFVGGQWMSTSASYVSGP